MSEARHSFESQVAVLNPGGRDPHQVFVDAAGPVDDSVHAPVNYHAYAACTRGVFCRDVSRITADIRHVILLLRSDFRPAHKAVETLLERGCKVALSFKESGAHQVAATLSDSKQVRELRALCERADLALASTPDLVALYRAAGARNVSFVPTPYPVDDPRWDFSAPRAERRGIFVGTREFDVPSRNHLAALLAARTLAERVEEPVTILNVDGGSGRRRLEALGYADGMLNIVERRLPYSEYLRLMAGHRLVWQLDRSAVPGQVAGDALLCRLPCVGGDGAIERVAFSRTCGHGRDSDELLDIAVHLLREDSAYINAVEGAQATAAAELSFKAGATKLARFFAV